MILQYICLLILIILQLANLMILYESYKLIATKTTSSGSSVRRKAIPKATRRWLLDQAESKCVACGRECCSPHIDHKLPVALGGTDEIDNLQVLCAACNLHKGAKHEPK